jgi:hypothetical protein
MGIDVEVYRARIGMFLTKLRHRRCKRYKTKYNSCTIGTDIHLRSLACNIVLMMSILLLYSIVQGHKYIIDNYADTSFEYYDRPNMEHGATCILSTVSEMSGGMYITYYSRLLMLSSDVELNPGPGTSEDTQLILNAIQEVKTDLKIVSKDIVEIKSELSCLKYDIYTIRKQVGGIEKRQDHFDSKLEIFDEKLNALQYEYDTVNNDLKELSLHDDINCEHWNWMEKQITIMESERIKNFLRILDYQKMKLMN